MTGPAWRWVRLVGGLGLLGLVVGRVGIGPFLVGLRTTNVWSLAGAAGIAAVTTVCCAWRWILVARGLGIGLPLGQAIAAYYRSQFLNTTLPGGVLGDVHRAVRHGRDVDDVGRGLRAVVLERSAGQFVQVVVTALALIVLPSPVRSLLPGVGIALVVVVLGVVALMRWRPAGSETRSARIWRTASADVRNGLLAPQAWPGILIASTLVVAGHASTFLIAARVAGCSLSTVRLVPIALLVLLAMAVPANFGGWGPREGVAAWAFGAAGLGAAQGLAASVVYGVMVIVACLPGAAVLAGSWIRRAGPRPDAAWPLFPALAPPGGAANG